MVHAVVIHRRNFIEKIFTLFRTVSSFCLISEDLQNDVLMVSEVHKIVIGFIVIGCLKIFQT